MQTSGGDILLIEDNIFDAELTMWTLKKFNIGNVVHVDTYTTALDYFAGTGKFASRNIADMPTVILLDLRIGGVSGLKLLEKLKEDEQTQNIPVVILSGSHQDTDIVKCMEMGAINYMIKPIDFSSFTKDILLPILLRNGD